MSQLVAKLGALQPRRAWAWASAWCVDSGPMVSRVVAAILGGYGLAALASVAALALPMALPQAVLTGMLASFAVYAAAVIWCFAARSASRAWAGLLGVALPLAVVCWGSLGQ